MVSLKSQKSFDLFFESLKKGIKQKKGKTIKHPTKTVVKPACGIRLCLFVAKCFTKSIVKIFGWFRQATADSP